MDNIKNDKDMMYIIFKLKSIEDSLKYLKIKIDDIDKIIKSNIDLIEIEKIGIEIKNELALNPFP